MNTPVPDLPRVQLGTSPSQLETTAAAELERMLAEHPEAAARLRSAIPDGLLLGTPESCPQISALQTELDMPSLGLEGFVIAPGSANPGQGLIAANSGRGVLYGVFRLIENLRLGKDWKIRSHPDCSLRIVWDWERMHKPYIHPPFDQSPTFFNDETMRDPANSAQILSFLRNLAAMGINQLIITNDLHGGPISTYIERADETRAFIRLANEYGLDVYVYGWLDPDECTEACPYNPAFKAFWSGFINKLHEAVPEAHGIYLNRFRNARGLWARECDHCRGKTGADRVRQAERILSELLRPFGGVLIEDWCTDDYTRQDREVDYAKEPGACGPDNVLWNIRGSYLDCGDPPCPDHPLLYWLKPGDSQLANLVVDLQVYPEMRGKEMVPCATAGLWSQKCRFYKSRGVDKLMGITETHPDFWEIAYADWYAFGRLAWNMNDSPRDIYMDWARLAYGDEVAATVVEILDTSFDVGVEMFYTAGARQAPLSVFWDLNATEAFVAGGVCDTPKAPPGQIGIKSPLDMYPAADAERIANDPRCTLLFHQLDLDDQLYDRLMGEKRDCVAKAQRMLSIWLELEGKIEPISFRSIELQLEQTVIDARIFEAQLEMYLGYRACTLTEAKLDAILAEAGDLVGSTLTGGSYELLDAKYRPDVVTPEMNQALTLRRFAEEIRSRGLRADAPAAVDARNRYEWGRWPE